VSDELQPLPKKRMVKVFRKFPKNDLLELLDYEPGDETDEGGYTIMENRMVDRDRWSIHHELVFKFEDKFYLAPYSVGATEYQDESPWQHESEFVQCYEVEQRPITTYFYVPLFNTVEVETNDSANAPRSV
jgi:hypothetical protein